MTSNKDIASETLRRNSERKFNMDYHKRQTSLAQVFGAIFTANVMTWATSFVILTMYAVIGKEYIPSPALVFGYLT